jgi:hypothetical protein
MAGCDARPGYPPDRTVGGDPRPCDPAAPARPGPGEKAAGCRAGVLAVAQVLLGARSEHYWLRICQTVAIWHNDKAGQPVMRSLAAYDH